MEKMEGATSEANEGNIASNHEFLRHRVASSEAQFGRYATFVHHASGGECFVFAVLSERDTELRRVGETELVAEASSRLVCINKEFQPTAIPDEMVKLLHGYLPPVTSHTHDEVQPHHDAPKHKETHRW